MGRGARSPDTAPRPSQHASIMRGSVRCPGKPTQSDLRHRRPDLGQPGPSGTRSGRRMKWMGLATQQRSARKKVRP